MSYKEQSNREEQIGHLRGELIIMSLGRGETELGGEEEREEGVRYVKQENRGKETMVWAALVHICSRAFG